MFNTLAFLVLLMSLGGYSAASTEVLSQIGKKYGRSKKIKLYIKKTSIGILNKKKVESGVIKLSKGKFRFDVTEGPKNFIVFDGQHIWSVHPPNRDLGTKWEIIKARPKTNGNDYFSIITDFKSIPKHFKTISKTFADGGKTIKMALTPKNPSNGIKKLSILVDKSTSTIVSLEFRDELDNLTQIEIEKTDFNGKFPYQDFYYKPPRGASVVTI